MRVDPHGPMLLLPRPCCPFTAATILGLKATVTLLLILLIKAKVRIVFFSGLGLLLLLLQTLLFLAASGGAAALAGLGLLGWGLQRRSAAA
jgi:hypothetical protein